MPKPELENACTLRMEEETLRGPNNCRPEYLDFLEDDENLSQCWHNFLRAEFKIVNFLHHRNITVQSVYLVYDYRPCHGGRGSSGWLRCDEGLETIPNACYVKLPVTEFNNRFGASFDFYAFVQDVGGTWGQPVLRANIFPFKDRNRDARIYQAVCSVDYKVQSEWADCFGLNGLGDMKLKPKAPPGLHWWAGSDFPNMDVYGNPVWPPTTTSPLPTAPPPNFTPLGIGAGVLLLLLALAACYDWRKGQARALASEVEMQ